jgi:molybdenum cofactor cytidylyltransferase
VTTAAVVLAAGGGRRFADGPKLLALFRGRPLVSWAVESALDAGLAETIVVIGSAQVRSALPAGITVIDNPRWAEGIATSLSAAVDVAQAAGHTAIVVGLGDQPLIRADAWALVAASTAPIAVATYEGERRNPVRLASSVWPLLPASGDEGARTLLRARPDLVTEVPCRGEPADVDTAADLEALERRPAPPRITT